MSALNWHDPFAVRAWFRDVEVKLFDLVTVAEDQTDPPASRMYGRAGAREIIDEASGGLAGQLAHARRGLTADEGWFRATVFPDARADGRRRVSLVTYDGSGLPDLFVLPEHLDEGRVRVVLLSDPEVDPVEVLIPSEAPGGTRVRVYGQHLVRVREP
jgi:hypothetical protein